MKKIFFAVFLLLWCFFNCENSNAQLSTVGKEFWVGFMDNYRILPDAPDQAVIVISANEDAEGVIEYLNIAVPFKLSKGQSFTHTVSSVDIDMFHRSSGNIENKGFYISSNGKIAVYAFNERYRSADGTVVLPISALGLDYMVTSHYEFLTVPVAFDANSNDESELLVIATEDDTEIEIIPSVQAYSGKAAGVPFTINLNRGQSYQLKAKADMTGTSVKVVGENSDSCKKIAVFGGNKWTTVGDCGGAPDNLFQQTYPTNSWGTSFVHVALSGRSSGELVKILASEDDTRVTIGGEERGKIDAGEFLSVDFKANETAKIETSKPSSVTVFSKSQECNQQNDPNYLNGDPFMISYSPIEQLLKEVTFNAMSLPSIVNHYLNIVVKDGTEYLSYLDGVYIGDRFSPVPGDPSFSYARINISQGVHRLENSEGFNAYVYGFGFIESYGFAVGAALENLNFETESRYDFEVTGDNVACLNYEGTWDIEPENPDYKFFEWDFGDGTEPVEGQEVQHTFTEPGIYEVIVKASISLNSCEEQEEINFEVEVLELMSEVELEGVFSVCADEEGLKYKLPEMAEEDISKWEFYVDGGEIVENYGDSIVVNWGPENDFAKISLIPFSPNGCPGDTISHDVMINKRLTAEIATGAEQVCFDPSVTYIYSVTNPLETRGYEWHINGGTIIGYPEIGEVEVSWDQAGVMGEVSYTMTSLVDDSCSGDSPVLEVNVASSIEVNVKYGNSIACSGEEDAEIELEITGGVGPYEVYWSHDDNLKQFIASGLQAGTYDVRVVDQAGCEVSLQAIEVVEPTELGIISVDSQPTSCYGKADGVLNLEIRGGVAPYTLKNGGLQSTTGIFSISDLAQGSYEWEFEDANGCEVPLVFEITSPLPLEVEVRMERPACPGGSNGSLFAFPEGGNEPYIYSWDHPLGNGNQLSGVPKGNYNLTVTDNSGCVSVGTGEVLEKDPEVRMPTGFNPAVENSLFEGVSTCEIDFQIWIYNRWGQLIYSGETGWDGLVSGTEAQTGSYNYVMQYSFPKDDEIKTVTKRGAFTLVR